MTEKISSGPKSDSIIEDPATTSPQNNTKYSLELNNTLPKVGSKLLFDVANSINNQNSSSQLDSDERDPDLKLDPLGLGLSIEGKKELNQ